MIKQDELANPNSCINRAADDEPIFVLRANDPIAPIVVRIWADCYASHKETENKRAGGALLSPAQVAKYKEARALSHLMEDWQKRQIANGVKS